MYATYLTIVPTSTTYNATWQKVKKIYLNVIPLSLSSNFVLTNYTHTRAHVHVHTHWQIQGKPIWPWHPIMVLGGLDPPSQAVAKSVKGRYIIIIIIYTFV